MKYIIIFLVGAFVGTMLLCFAVAGRMIKMNKVFYIFVIVGCLMIITGVICSILGIY